MPGKLFSEYGMDKKDIKNFTLEELKGEMKEISEPPYRAEQIFFWLYKRGALDFDDMSNIPKSLREKLERLYCISALEIAERLKARDGTEKFLFKLSDGNFIETVLIPSRPGRDTISKESRTRKTICLSTQVGCKYACAFCASGLMGFTRNLTVSEITNQILFLQRGTGQRITNFVFMGMGEPLDNFENLSRAIMIMNSPQGMGIASRRITVSSCGIIPGIEKLGNLGLQVNLSVSLHAANDALRDSLMPVNKRYPLKKLIGACEDFINATGRKITLEYILIKDKNDSAEDADELAATAKRLGAKVNLIPYSPIFEIGFQEPRRQDIDSFIKRLAEKRVNVTLRESKGKQIKAACGQLAGRSRLR